MLKVLFPTPLILGSILMLIDSLPTGLIVLPVALVATAIGPHTHARAAAGTSRIRGTIVIRGVLALAARGVEPERLILHGRSASHAAHLARHADVDVVLDAFPYHGTTTTCEALWMGTPVLTQRGDHHVARVGASLLHRVGLDEFVTDSADEFVARGVSLARAGRGALTSLRGELRERMRKSTLCDPKRLARELERVYRSAWRRWCARMQES